MKTTNIIKLAGVALVICGISANAQPTPGTWYLHTDAGGSWIHNLEVTDIGGTPVSGVEIEWDPGVRADIALGYNFTDQLAAEIEAGVVWNGAKSFGPIDLDDADSNLDLYQVPVLVNLVYNWPTGTRWTPYFGAGVGGMATWFIWELGGSEFSDVDFTFAYQGMAGIRYALSPNAQLDLGYKLLGTLDHEWEDQGGSFETDPTFTHSILLSLTWSF